MKTAHIATHFEEKNDPADLLTYSQNLFAKHSGNIWYPANANPTLAAFNTQTLSFAGLIAAWGTRVNHGSSQDHQNLLDGVKAQRISINGLKSYDENTTPGNAAAFLSAGWEVTDVTPGAVGVFPAPTGLHVILENHVVIPGRIHYGWNTVHGAHGYIVWTGTGAIPPALPPPSLPYQTVTHAHFDDVAPSGQSRWIIVGCVGTNPLTGYATLVNTIVP